MRRRDEKEKWEKDLEKIYKDKIKRQKKEEGRVQREKEKWRDKKIKGKRMGEENRWKKRKKLIGIDKSMMRKKMIK